MRSRCMSLLPRTTFYSDSEQLPLILLHEYLLHSIGLHLNISFRAYDLEVIDNKPLVTKMWELYSQIDEHLLLIISNLDQIG